MITSSLKNDIDFRNQLTYPLNETYFHQVIVNLLRFIFRKIMILKVEGVENIPSIGPGIIAANHVTNMDVFPMQLSISRPIFYMGKAELFQNSLAHYFFRQLGAFPVFRGARDEWAIMHSKRILDAGQILGLFPEGTRSKGRGLKVAKTGAARLALEKNCPVIPMSIDGSHQFFKTFPKKRIIRVIIGNPIHPEYGELPIGMTDRIMFEIARNLPKELRGVYSR